MRLGYSPDSYVLNYVNKFELVELIVYVITSRSKGQNHFLSSFFFRLGGCFETVTKPISNFVIQMMMSSSLPRIVRSFEVVNVESHAVLTSSTTLERFASAYITSRITVNTYVQCVSVRVCVCVCSVSQSVAKRSSREAGKKERRRVGHEQRDELCS